MFCEQWEGSQWTEWFIHILFLFYNSTGYGECLLDKPSGGTYDLSSQLPGSMYDVNKQCELTFGVGSQVCPYLVSENQTKSCLISTKKLLKITCLGIILSLDKQNPMLYCFEVEQFSKQHCNFTCEISIAIEGRLHSFWFPYLWMW